MFFFIAFSDLTFSNSSLTFNLSGKLETFTFYSHFFVSVNIPVNRSAIESSILEGRISKQESN
jgi:hypothetical protein